MAEERQRKQVTVLFADVSGFTAMSETMDAEDVGEVMNALWQKLDGAIVDHGGLIDKHIGDAVMALWGTSAGREDDPERAIQAALVMQAELQRFAQDQSIGTPLRMRIGINTGPVLLGAVGTTGEFTAMGDTVNIASRLEHAAPIGGILISRATHQHVRSLFDVTEQKPITVKGKSEPLDVFTVERAKPRAFRLETRGIEGIRIAMIGRESELEMLQDSFYAAVQSQQGRQVTVIGEAGIGKSRLLNEFDAWLAALPKKVTYFRGRADQRMQSQPYSLLRDLFVFHCQIHDNDDRHQVWRKLETATTVSLAGEGLSQRQLYLIGWLLGFEFPGEGPPEELPQSSKELRHQAISTISDFFQAASAQHPVVAFLEDIHWADDSSLEIMETLMTTLSGHGFMLLCLARPPLLERWPEWGQGKPYQSRLFLEPLSREETGSLIDQILQKVEDLPEALRTLIVENAQGNPFYVEELVKMLIEDGIIITSSAHWLVNPTRLPEVRIPPSLTGVLQARLDSLSEKERTLLQRAAVIGRAFWDEVLAFLATKEGEGDSEGPQDAEAEETRQLLETLRERELILPQESADFEGIQGYLFKNVVLREVTYESVLKKERRDYHAKVAKWLIEHSGERANEHASLIADHLERAQQRSEAIVYLKVAGEQAQKSSAFREALSFFRRALSMLAASDSEERMVLTRQIGKALYELGHWDAAKTQLQESLSIARQMANPHEIANNLRALGIVAESQGKYTEAKEWLQESLSSARAAADPKQIIASLHALGGIAEKQGKYLEAKDRLEESLSLARKNVDQVSAAQAANLQQALESASGAYDAAKSRVAEGISKLQLDKNRKRLSKSFGTLSRFARRKASDEEE